jgi:hypothetical protein
VTGPPAYALRKRRIEDIEEAFVAKIVALAQKSREEHAGDASRARAAAEHAAREAIDLTLLNALVAKHNRFYPCEANLPMDPKTGVLLERGRPWRPLEPVTLEGLLAKALG